MSDNTPAKFITVWPWHHDEPALYILCKVNADSNKLFENFEPHSSFRFQYQLLTMTTFFEVAGCYWMLLICCHCLVTKALLAWLTSVFFRNMADGDLPQKVSCSLENKYTVKLSISFALWSIDPKQFVRQAWR